MAYKIATTAKHAPWECRWARAGRRLCPDSEHRHPENLWICVRPTVRGIRRIVSEGECDRCEHWEVFEDES